MTSSQSVGRGRHTVTWLVRFPTVRVSGCASYPTGLGLRGVRYARFGTAHHSTP